VYSKQQRLMEAQTALQQALAIRLKVNGEPHPEVDKIRKELANLQEGMHSELV
jgi:hypothetical protein